jgi:hypothetical protein
MLDQGLDGTKRFSKGEDARGPRNLESGGFTAGDNEGDHAPKPFHLAGGDIVAGMGR